MAYIEFGTEYDVGVASIDQQHRGLADLINLIDDLIFARAPIDELQSLFVQLYDHTERHFLHEEDLFARTSFEHAAGHKREHAGLLLILKRFCQTFTQHDLNANPADHIAFLRTWLLDHIKSEDRLLGIHLNSLGIR